MKVTAIPDGRFFIDNGNPFESFYLSRETAIKLRDALNEKLPPSKISGDGKILQDLVSAPKRGDYVEATVSVTVDPDTGTYAPVVEEVKTFADKEHKTRCENFAILYRECKARGMI